MPEYVLTIFPAYYKQGFFNIPVDFDRYVRQDEGSIMLVLNEKKEVMMGKVNRTANSNGTARIMGGVQLRDWFQNNFNQKDNVLVEFLQLDKIVIKKYK